MSVHDATVRWQLSSDERFTDQRYSRAHTWTFDGGTIVPASASPAVVPLPMSCAEAVDPEEAFVASLASCHMLWFLSIAARRGFQVLAYCDEARGTMGKNPAGKQAMLRVELHPLVTFDGDTRPTIAEIEAMHHAAHEACYIAHSVVTEIVCLPTHSSP